MALHEWANWRGVYSISLKCKISGRAIRIGAILTAMLVWMPLVPGARSIGAGPTLASGGPVAAARPKKAPRPVLPSKPVKLPEGLNIPRYAPGPLPFRDGETLIYQTAWVGIPAAEVRVSVMQTKTSQPRWIAQMWITSSKVVDLLYRMRDYIREDFAQDSLRPAGMYLLQREKRRNDEWRVSFDPRAHLVTCVRKNRQGRIWTRRFSGGDPFGPFSGAMLALSQPLRIGRTYTFDVFSGGNRYVLAFTVRQRERITTALGTFDTLRIEPAVVWLSEGSFRSQARKTTLWVTDDALHLPLRIDAVVFIGNVRAELVRIINGPELPPTAPATHVAARGNADGQVRD
jgi:uncharacterized protein DUF3108